MSLKSVVVMLSVVACGLLGGTVAYRVASSASTPADAAARESVVIGEEGQGKRGPRFAPCKAPAKLEAGTCVTDLVRTLVVPGAAAIVQRGSGSAQPAGSGQHDEGRDDGEDGDDHGHHSGEGEAGHHSDDDGRQDEDDSSGHGGGDDDSDDFDDSDDDSHDTHSASYNTDSGTDTHDD